MNPRPAILYADPAQVEEALRSARPGACVTYAYGHPIDRGNPVVLLVEGLAKAGLVSLHQASRDALGRAVNVARRLDPAAAKAARGADPAARDQGAGGGSPSIEVRLKAAGFAGRALKDAARLVALIERAAREGRACPSYAGLAEALNLRDRERARYLIRQLTKAQVLTVWSRPRTGLVVGIAGTRLQTAEPALDAPRALAGDIARVFGA